MAEAVNKYERHTFSYKLMYFLMKNISELTQIPFPKIGVPTYAP